MEIYICVVCGCSKEENTKICDICGSNDSFREREKILELEKYIESLLGA